LTAAVPASVYPLLAAAVPEAVFLPLPETEDGHVCAAAGEPLRQAIAGATAVVVGCGLGAGDAQRELIQQICDMIVEVVLSRSKEILVASCRYPAELVRSRFLKLNYDHILYVLDCLERTTTKVKNIRKYLMAALFNAPVTIDGYYRAEVKHDVYRDNAYVWKL
jgi:hypothetical protein